MVRLKVKGSLTKINLKRGDIMSEGIKLESLIHKKCGKGEIIEYGGGDKSYHCNHCKEWIFDLEKEVLTKKEYLANFRQWREGLGEEED